MRKIVTLQRIRSTQVVTLEQSIHSTANKTRALAQLSPSLCARTMSCGPFRKYPVGCENMVMTSQTEMFLGKTLNFD